jgi:DNA topoisomerase-3
VKENYRRYACTSCDFSIGKHPGGRTFEPPEVEALLQDRQIGPMQGFISKMGRPFAAILKLDGECKLEFDFGQRDEDNAEPVDFSELQPLGACPKCSARVFEHGMSYLCEKSVGPERSCDFKSGKVILQQEVSAQQMSKLLETGKTDLLEGFVSSRTNRKIKAYLARGADGKVSFEVEARPDKPARKGAARAPTKTAAKTAAKTAVKKTTVKKSAVKKAAVKKATTKKAATGAAVKLVVKKVTAKKAVKKVASSAAKD